MGHRLRVFSIALSLVLLPLRSVFAVPLSFKALESPIGRFLISETGPGLALMSRILGRATSTEDFEPFLARLQAAHPDTAGIIEARVATIRETYRQAERERERDAAESDSFSASERSILRGVAERELALDPEWNPMDPYAGKIRFVSEKTAGYRAKRDAFLAEANEGISRVEALPGEGAPEPVQRSARRHFWEMYKDSQGCLARRPKSKRWKDYRSQLAQQMLISSVVSTGSYVARVGITHFDFRVIGTDLLTAFVHQAVSLGLMDNVRSSFIARWVMVHGLGSARSEVDAQIYQLVPWTDTQGIPMDEAVEERKAYSYEWNSKTSWISPILYTVLRGAECVMEEKGSPLLSTFKVGAFAFRTSVSVGTALWFYGERGQKVRSSAIH